MREECPVCKSKNVSDDWSLYFEVPDGWSLSKENKVCCCLNCGFIYFDNNSTQEDYNKYYLDHYGKGMDRYENYIRLDALAAQISDYFKDKSIRIRDFGGGSTYLVDKLIQFGFKDSGVWNVGDTEPDGCDLINASHVIEHIYDLNGQMETFKRVIKPGGFIMVDVPDATGAFNRTWPTLMTYQIQHCNQFTPLTLDLLFSNHGFSALDRGHYQIPLYNTFAYRALYQFDKHLLLWNHTRNLITSNAQERARKLQEIDESVIVWGYANPAWHILPYAPNLKVVYFVDKNSYAFPEGSTVNGIPVYDNVHSDEPIVVIAEGQKQSILDNIKELGLKNKVIEI